MSSATGTETPEQELERNYRDGVAALAASGGTAEAATAPTPEAPVRPDSRLTHRIAREVFEAMLESRNLDFAARYLRKEGPGVYTISSAGHESNAAIAAALRPTDPALLHYRSGAFYCARAHQVPGSTPLQDVLLGLVAAADEPISGGRHKVFGHHALAVIPQTSTIASHLPRAMGVGFAIERAQRIGLSTEWPTDAVAICSFGDASLNHSTAVGALNAAEYTVHQGLPMPVLFCCEDNGFGISVRTPRDWVSAVWSARPHLRYFTAEGTDIAAVYETALEAAEYVRSSRRPAFLHLRCVRYLGHAGTDPEIGYRSRAEISEDLTRDPLVHAARLLVEAGAAEPGELVTWYEAIAAEVRRLADDAAGRPRLSSASEVMAPIGPRRPSAVAAEARRAAEPEARASAFGSKLPEDAGPLTLAESINATLTDALAARPEMLLFGEDVGRKGGVYGVTRGLQRRFGITRVFDSLLDEQTILGVALGAGVSGLLPVPEIQYLAYLHNAEDQLRGEAATLPFFSRGQYRNPMVVRIAGYGYQKGFGGHFHNDDAVAVLRDIPGIVVASPALPDDAAAVLRTCLASAASDGSTCVFLEPIALYHTRDLFGAGDGGWARPYAPPEQWAASHAPIGSARLHGDGGDLTIVSFANGTYMSLRVARRLAEDGIAARVLDLRWLVPLPEADILREAGATGRVLIVDETRRSGGVSEGIVSALVDGNFDGSVVRVTSQDSFVPLGEAANRVLLQEAEIEAAARSLVASVNGRKASGLSLQEAGTSETSSRASLEGPPASI
ncbi:MAG TPA: thiamine pyrophosphate-dependent enzyme [Solirubrobacteraceae bacterium]|nr:thiamine pyrophosphate-dependent enzyme [Solirubrobacteraceae bacterium]